MRLSRSFRLRIASLLSIVLLQGMAAGGIHCVDRSEAPETESSAMHHDHGDPSTPADAPAPTDPDGCDIGSWCAAGVMTPAHADGPEVAHVRLDRVRLSASPCPGAVDLTISTPPPKA